MIYRDHRYHVHETDVALTSCSELITQWSRDKLQSTRRTYGWRMAAVRRSLSTSSGGWWIPACRNGFQTRRGSRKHGWGEGWVSGRVFEAETPKGRDRRGQDVAQRIYFLAIYMMHGDILRLLRKSSLKRGTLTPVDNRNWTNNPPCLGNVAK